MNRSHRTRNIFISAAGQTEALIELPPGKLTIQLVLGDRSHHLFHPPLMSDVITVNVNVN